MVKAFRLCFWLCLLMCFLSPSMCLAESEAPCPYAIKVVKERDENGDPVGLWFYIYMDPASPSLSFYINGENYENVLKFFRKTVKRRVTSISIVLLPCDP